MTCTTSASDKSKPTRQNDEDKMNKTVILGAGIAGLSAAYHLKQKGITSAVFEQESDWGGLCGNFSISGFRFDRFVHLSFAPDEYTQKMFDGTGGMHEHVPYPTNYYHGYWIKHPAQNNLHPLGTEEKINIINDFVNRPQREVSEISDYEEWLRCQYGNYFAEHFPFAYTRKYWGVEPRELETKWVGIRMTSPDLSAVLRGAFEPQDKCFYYAKVMKYPKSGGFKSILNTIAQNADIRLNKQACHIDPAQKRVRFADGSVEEYSQLVSSLPLPEIIKMLPDVPENIRIAAQNLRYTCGYQISLGFKRPDIAKHLWFYIYDEDIAPARVYSPSLKSPDNAPAGCSSLQAEIFFANGTPLPDAGEMLEKTIGKLIEMSIFKAEDLIVKDIRFEKFANIIFDRHIYQNRQIILDYLQKQHIHSIGRFGKWEYFWTFQAFADGMNLADKEEFVHDAA